MECQIVDIRTIVRRCAIIANVCKCLVDMTGKHIATLCAVGGGVKAD